MGNTVTAEERKCAVDNFRTGKYHSDFPVRIPNTKNEPLYIGSMHTVLSEVFGNFNNSHHHTLQASLQALTDDRKPCWTIVNLSNELSFVPEAHGEQAWRSIVVDLPLTDTQLSTADDVKVFLQMMERGRAAIVAGLAQQQQILVHCYAGMNRSAALLCYYLQMDQGYNVSQSIQTLTEANKTRHYTTQTLINCSYRSVLHMLCMAKRGLSVARAYQIMIQRPYIYRDSNIIGCNPFLERSLFTRVYILLQHCGSWCVDDVCSCDRKFNPLLSVQSVQLTMVTPEDIPSVDMDNIIRLHNTPNVDVDEADELLSIY